MRGDSILSIPAFQVKAERDYQESTNAGSKHPYRCECGQVLFKAYKKPVGLQIKCPRCKKLVEY